MMPIISIITASYNSEKYIEDSIRSVISQTYNKIEYIIIDGNSTDKTMHIVNRYRKHIDKVVSENDKGIYDAFNKGISKSNGDVILFLNSDDYLCDNYIISKIANFFHHNPEYKCIYGNIKIVNEKTGFSHIKGSSNFSNEDIKKGRWPQHPALFLTKDIYQKYMFDLKYKIASDLDLIIKLFKDYETSCHYVDLVVTVFRQNGISNNINTIADTWRETNEIFTAHFGFERYTLDTTLTSIIFYKKWIEILLLMNRPLSLFLKDKVNKAAIFGSLELAAYVQKDLIKSDITTVTFLDNNPLRHGDLIDGVEVRDPIWLKTNHKYIDVVIIAIEHDCYSEIRSQIRSILNGNKVDMFTWKEMIALNYEK